MVIPEELMTLLLQVGEINRISIYLSVVLQKERNYVFERNATV